MAIENIYRHNARSYYDVYNPLISAYPRKPTWVFKEIAGMLDHQSELTNAIATDILYPITRESAYAFASSCDYEPIEADGASDTLTIVLTSAMSKQIDAGYKFRGISLSTGKMVDFETTAIGDSAGTNTIVVAAKQKTTVQNQIIGNVLNSDDFFDYPIDGFLNIIKTSISLTIDGLEWTRVEYFDASASTDRCFQLLYQSSGKCRIRFGDAITGAKPTVGSTIYANFETTQGASGRMDAGQITINAGADTDIKTVTNAGSTGGNDAETVVSIIRNARSNVRLRDIVWSVEDLELAARAASASVVKALGFPSTGSASIHIIPAGGGVPTSGPGGLIETVETYVQARTQFGAMPITGVAPNYVPVNITAATTIRSGYDATTVRNLVKFALILAASAIDSEIIDYYIGYGIDSCRINLINYYYSLGFTSADNDALSMIIEKWEGVLGARDYREWGQTLEVGQLWVMGDSLYDYGSDIFNLTSPASNVTCTSTEIITNGTVTVS